MDEIFEIAYQILVGELIRIFQGIINNIRVLTAQIASSSPFFCLAYPVLDGRINGFLEHVVVHIPMTGIKFT